MSEVSAPLYLSRLILDLNCRQVRSEIAQPYEMHRTLMHAFDGHPVSNGEKPPEQLLVSFESGDGSGVLKMDQPLSSFAERRFGARFVRSEWIPFPQEVSHVPA